MDIRRELMVYLETYGNTKEADLIGYGARVLGQPREDIRRIIDKMFLEGNAKRVIHDKLGSNVVYVAKNRRPVDLAQQVNTDTSSIRHEEKIAEELGRMLKETDVAANRKKIRKSLGSKGKS